MMEKEYFLMMEEIKNVFDIKNFPEERVRLIWHEVRDLNPQQFRKIVNHFIGNKPIQYPPLLKDFIDCAHEQRSEVLAKQTKTASASIFSNSVTSGEGLKKILEESGCKRLIELVRKKA